MTTLHNFTVERLDGTTYDMASVGVLVRNFIVYSPFAKHRVEYIESRDGFLDLGSVNDGRTLRADVTFISNDFASKRNELFRIFASKESFYIISDYEPTKRYLVKCEDMITPTQIGTSGEFSLVFKSPSAYAESVAINSVAQTTTTFSINNPSDIAIDPRELPLLIKYEGASTNLKITNDTTGDVWQLTGTTVAGDVIELDGIQSKKNGASVFGNTNKKLITLAEGNNVFTLTGTSGSFTITFEFRTYSI